MLENYTDYNTHIGIKLNLRYAPIEHKDNRLRIPYIGYRIDYKDYRIKIIELRI